MLVLSFFSMSTYAQSSAAVVAENIKVTATDRNLEITWTENNRPTDGTWQVQASENGNDYTIIGLVWGPDPKGAKNQYQFKQTWTGLKKRYQSFRVLYASADNKWETGKAVFLTK